MWFETEWKAKRSGDIRLEEWLDDPTLNPLVNVVSFLSDFSRLATFSSRPQTNLVGICPNPG